MDPEKERRVACGQAALDGFVNKNGSSGDLHSDFADMLADLMHWAVANDVDYLAASTDAEMHFEEESSK